MAKTHRAEVEPVTYTSGICVIVSRLQDAVSLVSLFHMIHPQSESAQEAASQQAAGTDLLKVRTPTLARRIPTQVADNWLAQFRNSPHLKKRKKND